tara:strand:+ start:6625 stop:8343 length:1719 start_codon:yes stop_codon:yes gene_type:complete
MKYVKITILLLATFTSFSGMAQNSDKPRGKGQVEETLHSNEYYDFENASGFLINNKPFAGGFDPWTYGCIWQGSSCIERKPSYNAPVCNFASESCKSGTKGDFIDTDNLYGYYCHSAKDDFKIFCTLPRPQPPEPECKILTPEDNEPGCEVGERSEVIESDGQLIWTCKESGITEICISDDHDNPVNPENDPPVCGTDENTCDTGSVSEVGADYWMCENDGSSIYCNDPNAGTPICGTDTDTCDNGDVVQVVGDPETWRCKVGADVIDCSVDEFDCNAGDTVVCAISQGTFEKACSLKITENYNSGDTVWTVGTDIGSSNISNCGSFPTLEMGGTLSSKPVRCTESGLTCDTGGGGSPTMPPQTCDCSSYGPDWYSVSNTSGGAPYCSSSSAYEDRACPELELSSKPLTACGYSIYDETLGIKKDGVWELYCNDELNNKTLMTEAEYKNLINQYFIGGFDQSGFINNYLKDSGANVSTNNEVYTYGDGTVQEVDYFYFRGGKNNMIINLDIMTETSEWGDYQYFNLSVYDDLYNTSGGNSRTSFVNYFLVRNTNTGNFEYFEIYKEIDEVFK